MPSGHHPSLPTIKSDKALTSTSGSSNQVGHGLVGIALNGLETYQHVRSSRSRVFKRNSLAYRIASIQQDAHAPAYANNVTPYLQRSPACSDLPPRLSKPRFRTFSRCISIQACVRQNSSGAISYKSSPGEQISWQRPYPQHESSSPNAGACWSWE